MGVNRLDPEPMDLTKLELPNGADAGTSKGVTSRRCFGGRGNGGYKYP